MADPQISRPPFDPIVGWRVAWFCIGGICIYGLCTILSASDIVRLLVTRSGIFVASCVGLGPAPPEGAPWGISFKFDDRGASLLRGLTRKNHVPFDHPSRDSPHLAMVLDRKVIAAPFLNSEIGAEAHINGRFSDDQADLLVKALRSGANLEFCILANSMDDTAAIEETIRFMTLPAVEVALEEARATGRLPPVPRTKVLEGDPKSYTLALADGAKCRVTYRWIEVGQSELRTLGLDSVARDDPTQISIWKDAAKFRGRAAKLPEQWGDRELLGGALFYSRERRIPRAADDEAAEALVDYFVLARGPEIDPATGKEQPTVSGGDVVFADKVSMNFQPSIWDTRKPTEFALLGMLAVLGVVITLNARWARVRWAFLIGQWLAVILGLIILSVS